MSSTYALRSKSLWWSIEAMRGGGYY